MERAKEYCHALRDATDNAKKYLDTETQNQLESALYPLFGVWYFLGSNDEEIHAQISPLFIEACDGIPQILSHIKDQGLRSGAVGMISELVQQKLKPEIILDRINASKPCITPPIITVEMLKPVYIFLDALGFLLGANKLAEKDYTTYDMLRGRVNFTSHFLRFTADQCIEHEKMKDLFVHAVDVAYTAADLTFLNLHSTLKEDQVSTFLERTSPFRPELRQLYLSVLIWLKSAERKTRKVIFELDHIVSSYYLCWGLKIHVKELISRKGSLKAAFGDSICWLERGLHNVDEFYRQMHKEKVFKDLDSCHSHEQALAVEAGILIYSLFDEEMENYHVLIPLLAKLNHVAIFTEVIRLLTEIWRPVTGPLKDLALNFKEELIFLRTFLMFSLEQCTEQTKLTEVLTVIQSLTTEAWSAIDSFYLKLTAMQERLPWDVRSAFSFIQNSEQESLGWKARSAIDSSNQNSKQESLALESSLFQFHWLFKFNFMKAVIRQICPTISASSEPAHPMTNLLNFLPANFEVIDSYFNTLKYLKTYILDEVLLGFHDYILENLLLKADLEFTLRGFHHTLLHLVTFLVDPPNQYVVFKKKNNLLTKVGAVAIEAEAAISLFYEDAPDSNTNRKVIFMVRLLTVATRLIKSEDNLMEILKYKTALEAHEELILEFLMDLLRQRRELDKFDDVLMCAEFAVNKASLISISSSKSLIDGSIMGKISDFLLGIEAVKVALKQVCTQTLDASLCNTTLTDVEGLINFLLNHPDEVLDHDAGSIMFLKKRVPVIKEKLVLLRPFYADVARHHNMHRQLQDLVKNIQDAAAGTKYVFFFSVRGYRPAWYDMLFLSDVKQLLKFIEEQVRMIIPGVPDSSSYSFPRTNGLGFLDCLLGKLEEMLCSNHDTVIDLKHQIGSVKDGLLCLRDQFADVYDANGEVYGLVTSATEMAYKVEFVIDSCLVNCYPLWYKVLWISKVIENIKRLNKTFHKKEIGVC